MFKFIIEKYPTHTPIIIFVISLLITVALSARFIEKIFNYVRDNMFKTEKT